MASRAPSAPAFGEADLSNCEREQIHLAASIQPCGVLLALREPELSIIQASANAADFLGRAEHLYGHCLADLGGDVAERVQPFLEQPLNPIPVAIRCRVGGSGEPLDGLLHRPGDGSLVLELERAGPSHDLTPEIERGLQTVLNATSLRELCDKSAEMFKRLAGYDRVMVYRFDDQGHGEVYAEERNEDLEPYLGNHYPASDIPQIARQLYKRNRIRVLADVNYEATPLQPRYSPLSEQDLDMSLCFLRSMSPIHIQYLKNMGVGATLVASLVVGGQLWGLIACHHYAPRFLHYEMRAACELLAEAVATRIAALESYVRAEAELSTRRLEQRMIDAVTKHGDWRAALLDNPQSLLKPVGAFGAALLYEDEIRTVGDVPSTTELRRLGQWLDSKPRQTMFATSALARDAPEFADMTEVASGLLAVPLSSTKGEYIFWFRPERVQMVTWGGNPFKAVVVGDDPADLSPRRSFAQWHQLVEGTAEDWSAANNAAARLIGETVADILLQFRSVRTLIAQDQLQHVSLQVRESEHPVLVADAQGRILIANDAFDPLIPSSHATLERVEDIAQFCAHPAEVRRMLQDVVRHRRAWNGEILFHTRQGVDKPMMVRADPVSATPNRLLGYVVLLSDLSEQKAAESARRRFQQDVVGQNGLPGLPLESETGLTYRNLMSSVVGNAQLAALEITEGIDLTRVPEMLDSVRASTDRTSELLQHLVRHAQSARD